MKKTVAFLFLILAFSGMTFASFHIEKKNLVNISNSVDINKNLSVSAIADAKSNSELKSKTITSTIKGGETDKNTAILLAIVSVLLLPFGLHNWYLGRKKQALWQTLMIFPGAILLGIPALISWIWQLVDMIKLLSGKSL